MASPAIWGHGEVLARAANEGHVWVHVYAVAGVGVNVLPIENMGTSLVRAAARDHVDVQWLCIAGLAPHWI